MLTTAEFGDRTAGDPLIEHPHSPELIMRWIDACTDARGQRVAGDSMITTNPVTHRDQLVAVWVEQTTGLPPIAC